MTPPILSKPTVLMCIRAPERVQVYFSDDQFGFCAQCGFQIRFRPHAVLIKEKMCVECVKELMREEGRAIIGVTAETAAELKRYGKQS